MTGNNEGVSLTLPNESQLRNDLSAINRFQQIVHQTMVNGHDYGIIPGTKKPTLLKPGAEKIVKLLGLADQYEIMDKVADWEKGFFHYEVRCVLTSINNGVVVSSGMGECNSMESKYRWRWLWPNEVPEVMDKSKMVTKEITTKENKKVKMYRIPNDEIYSQVNTILKMAKKRALIDAALSAGRLSEVFTQDVEDMDIVDSNGYMVEEPENEKPEPGKPKGLNKSQADKMRSAMESKGYTAEEIQAHIQKTFKKSSGKDLTKEEGDLLISDIENEQVARIKEG